MRTIIHILIILAATLGQTTAAQQAPKPLDKNGVMEMVKARTSTADVVKQIHDRGINFDFSDDYVQALRTAGAEEPVIQALRSANPKPLDKNQLLELLTGGVANQRAGELVKERGIDFQADDAYLQSLRKSGASAALIAIVREASAAAAQRLTVGTSPNAQVFLDGQMEGRADDHGELVLDVRLGTHTLKVSLAGKLDYEQPINVYGGPAIRIDVPLADALGSIRVNTMAGAAVVLDEVSRGTVDATGQIVLDQVPRGPHELRVSASGKRDDRRTITVTAGGAASAEVMLADSEMVNPKDGAKYVWIPPGNFRMGCSPGDQECTEVELPAHKVTITAGFWMGQTEVTVSAYKRFAKAAGLNLPPYPPKVYKGWKVDGLPIVDATWDEARSYCAWAGGRLPTEAEWEYAARGGVPRSRYGNLEEIAWYKTGSGNETHEVGKKLPNRFGLMDVLGNVWEWVNDWFDKDYYKSSPLQDPPGPASGLDRILRGGSWIEDTKLLRASDRYYSKPGVRSDFFGFRCVLPGTSQ